MAEENILFGYCNINNLINLNSLYSIKWEFININKNNLYNFCIKNNLIKESDLYLNNDILIYCINEQKNSYWGNIVYKRICNKYNLNINDILLAPKEVNRFDNIRTNFACAYSN